MTECVVKEDYAISGSLLSAFAADDIQRSLDRMCLLAQGHLLAIIGNQDAPWARPPADLDLGTWLINPSYNKVYVCGVLHQHPACITFGLRASPGLPIKPCVKTF